MSYIYTYEVAHLVHVSANSLDEANEEFHATVEELLSMCESPDYEWALCHLLDRSGETLFEVKQEFIPYPLAKGFKSKPL
jgi:hypothetical protein